MEYRQPYPPTTSTTTQFKYVRFVIHLQSSITDLYLHDTGFFQEETSQIYANALKVSNSPPTLNSLKSFHRHALWPNGQPAQHPWGQQMPLQLGSTPTTPKNKQKKVSILCSCFLYLLMHSTTPPPSHLTHPTPFSLSPLTSITPQHDHNMCKHTYGEVPSSHLKLTNKTCRDTPQPNGRPTYHLRGAQSI
jgi:hypothetical protein